MENSQLIRISPLGLQDLDLKVLEVAHALLKDDGIECELLENTDVNGELVVIDSETEAGQQLYPQLKESQVKIVLTSGAIKAKNTVSLSKPVRVTTLKDVLSQVCNQVYEYIAKQKDLAHKATPVSEITSEAGTVSQNIFQILLDAKVNEKCIRLTCTGEEDLFINGPDRTLYSNSDQTIPEEYFKVEQGELSVIELDHSQLKQFTKDMTPHAIDAELWHTGIECSKGNLLSGHRSDTPVKLKAWPNFSRQGFKPEFFKIAAIMAKQLISLDELSKVSGVPLDIIVDFYNAAYAVGLVEMRSDITAETINKKTMTVERKTLLGKLAQRLRFA